MSIVIGETLTTRSGRGVKVEQFLGAGGQGEVYRVIVEGQPFALKWYFPNQATPAQREAIERLVTKGAPTDRFLWPIDLVEPRRGPSFGYLMPLREPRFKDLAALVSRRAVPRFRELCTIGYEISESYFQLHMQGLAYRDISFGNVFFDPRQGEVRICDTDNVGVTGKVVGGVLGTPRFMAPEIVRCEAQPSTATDLFSVAVLLFYLFIQHHPLEGKREAAIHSFDLPAMNRLYGEQPIFIFDPIDDTNRPVPGYQQNAITFWPLYPQFLRDLFVQSFTTGLRDPKNGRVRESQWRRTFVQLRDSIIYCPGCKAQNFLDLAASAQHCWGCQASVPPPPRIDFDKGFVLLNFDAILFPHHLGDDYDFRQAVAEVTRHPTNPNIWGLKNLSQSAWDASAKDGSMSSVAPGKSITLNHGTTINFGKARGTIVFEPLLA